MAWTSFAILATFLSKTGCFSGGSTTAIRGHPRKWFWTERLLGFSWVLWDLRTWLAMGKARKLAKLCTLHYGFGKQRGAVCLPSIYWESLQLNFWPKEQQSLSALTEVLRFGCWQLTTNQLAEYMMAGSSDPCLILVNFVTSPHYLDYVHHAERHQLDKSTPPSLMAPYGAYLDNAYV